MTCHPVDGTATDGAEEASPPLSTTTTFWVLFWVPFGRRPASLSRLSFLFKSATDLSPGLLSSSIARLYATHHLRNIFFPRVFKTSGASRPRRGPARADTSPEPR